MVHDTIHVSINAHKLYIYETRTHQHLFTHQSHTSTNICHRRNNSDFNSFAISQSPDLHKPLWCQFPSYDEYSQYDTLQFSCWIRGHDQRNNKLRSFLDVRIKMRSIRTDPLVIKYYDISLDCPSRRKINQMISGVIWFGSLPGIASKVFISVMNSR